jgi:hypothetical protein
MSKNNAYILKVSIGIICETFFALLVVAVGLLISFFGK